jgi:hypothetical protein
VGRPPGPTGPMGEGYVPASMHSRMT